MKARSFLFIFFALILASCKSTSVHETTMIDSNMSTKVSETATINDTLNISGRGGVDVFFVDEINGIKVFNAFKNTTRANFGQNKYLYLGFHRAVPVEPIQLKLVGAIYRSAPIFYITNNDYGVEGIIEFVPSKGQRYIVNGSLSQNDSRIWVEDIDGNIVSEIVTRKTVGKQVFTENIVNKIRDNVEFNSKSSLDIFHKLHIGEHADLIIAKLGKPDRVEIKKSIFSMDKAHYFYNELGKLTFTIAAAKPQYLISRVPKFNDSTLKPTNFYHILNIGDSSSLRELGKFSYVKHLSDIELLDALANKVWAEKKSQNRHMNDAICWFIRVLGQTENTRYVAMLQKINDDKNLSSKLRKYAKSAISNLARKNKNVELFIPKEPSH